jgi:chloramphenicol-sensitive protein RarD
LERERRNGILCGLAAFGLWGVMPLYFVTIRHVPPLEVLGQRIVWSVLLLAVVLSIVGRWEPVLRCLRSPKIAGMFLTSALFLSGNWLIYIYGVSTHQTVETSLGYFINPLLNVALGMVLFHERLRPAQVVALVLGVLAVTILIAKTGSVPWIALSLAVSFATYGLLRKITPADAVVGLSIETIILFPMALAYLAYLGFQHQMTMLTSDRTTVLLLMASGIITTVPLLCFGQAARSVPLSMLGFMQFLAPSMQFVLAITALGEEPDGIKYFAFLLIWIGLAIYSIDSWWVGRTAKTDDFVQEQVIESAGAEP